MQGGILKEEPKPTKAQGTSIMKSSRAPGFHSRMTLRSLFGNSCYSIRIKALGLRIFFQRLRILHDIVGGNERRWRRIYKHFRDYTDMTYYNILLQIKYVQSPHGDFNRTDVK